MGDDSLQKDVLQELGDDRIEELAGELGTDTETAKRVVEATVAELPDELTAAPAGVQGLAGLGGGLMSGVLAKLSGPVANAVAKKTGLPPATVARALELLLPVVLTTIAKRRNR
ncbi:DUF937 domain-containing protein [Streptomyces sp. NPDC051162]|uniref:DUF937 domain-containing protein n=1 Tax=unclassified Streptomyces TaxID=2593676 RepID=UPI00343CE9FD